MLFQFINRKLIIAPEMSEYRDFYKQIHSGPTHNFTYQLNIEMQPQMKMIIIMGLCIINSRCLQLLLKQSITCLSFTIQKETDKLLFTYHHNFNINTAELVVYHAPGQVLLTSGSGPNYQNYMEGTFHAGQHKLCFYKQEDKDLQVHFDIITQQEQVPHAGKEDLNKLTQRIGEFLLEIKKTGWGYKEMLTQHNNRQLKLDEYQRSNILIYGIKVVVMLGILGAQIWAVRIVFD